LYNAIRVLNVEVDAVTLDDAVAMIGEAIDARRGHGAATFQVATINPEFVMRARWDAAFRRILRDCSLRVADGVGITLAGRILGHPFPERVIGVDLVVEVARAAATRGDRVFLLGGAPGVAEAAAARLTREAPGLEVVGTLAGDSSEAGDPEALAAIAQANPDLILVAYGAPAQELWSARNLPVSNAAAAIGVGGTLDYLAGRAKRAPSLVRRLGLEWLFRLITQPARARRMSVLPLFLLLVLRQRFLRR
jgi:N-acetylglucosaminyldiphosphoundecaprenol N-acetyl-beta-D-mannosaminyltransferase